MYVVQYIKSYVKTWSDLSAHLFIRMTAVTGNLHEESCDECDALKTCIDSLFRQIGRQNEEINALLNARISCLNRMTQCPTYTLTVEDHGKLIERIVQCTRQVRDTELEFYKVLNTEAKHGGPTHTACLDPVLLCSESLEINIVIQW